MKITNPQMHSSQHVRAVVVVTIVIVITDVTDDIDIGTFSFNMSRERGIDTRKIAFSVGDVEGFQHCRVNMCDSDSLFEEVNLRNFVGASAAIRVIFWR